MTPLGKIEEGIVKGDWAPVCEGFNKLTGKKLTPPKPIVTTIESIFDPQKATKKELYLVKLNCLNEDGTVHKSTKRFHKTLSYTQIGGRRVVSNVNKVLGEKDLKDYSLDSLLIEYEGSVQVLPVNKNFVCSPKSDNNNIVNYNY